MIFALVGNPNSGKTTLFNSLTGSSAHVGNWPGVTIEHKEGFYKTKNSKEKHTIIDLPGLYSLTPYSAEEDVTKKFLTENKIDAIINIVDATNPERNFYLTSQLSELDVPVIIALNMIDVVEKTGTKINIESLAADFGLPFVPVSAQKNKGIDALMDVVINAAAVKREGKSFLKSEDVEEEVKKTGYDIDEVTADLRYKEITLRVERAYVRTDAVSRSEKIDKVLTNKWASIPIFMGIMFLIFHFTFSENFLFLKIFGLKEGVMSPGIALQTGLGWLMGKFIDLIARALESSPLWVSGLIVDGLLSGLNAVFSFLPQILLLFIFLSVLEDSGYMARVAFIMDRAFRRFGLSGKAFMPLLMCFGCAVPGIMATRTLGNERERKIAIFVSPFFSCGAKLPIWATVAAAVFPKNADMTVFLIYFLGIAVAVLAALILGKTILKGETPPFILELPAYHLPYIKNISAQLWEKLKHYLFRAGTVIAGAIVVIWFLSNFSFAFRMTEPSAANSMLGWIGRILQPLFVPLGFGMGENGWKFVVAIITGLIAKEMVVATLGVFSGTDSALEAGAGEIAGTSLGLLLSGLSGPAAAAFMAFNLLSVPCMAAVGTAIGEFKSKKVTFTAIAFWIVTAYIVSLIIYWTGVLFTTFNIVGLIVGLSAAALVIFTVVFNVLRKRKLKASGQSACGGDCGGCGNACSVRKDKKDE